MSFDTPNLPPIGSASSALSKRLGSLQQFQSRVAARIAQAQSGEQALESLLSLQVQGYRLLLSLSDVNELLEAAELTHLPLAKRWVLGLTVVRSEVLTVFDLGYCLSNLLLTCEIEADSHLNVVDKARLSDTKLVVLAKTVANQLAFIADKIVGTVVPTQDGLTISELPSPQSAPYIKTLWRNEQGLQYIQLSFSELLKSSDFIKMTH
jgi:chemotaxis signal transduction protein